eukprot:1890156-Prorocentrum_lima.AAC.1
MQDIPSALWDDLYYCSSPQQILSALWELERPTHRWSFAVSAHVTLHDNEDVSVDFYLPSYMALWHPKCPHKLQEGEQL